MRWHRCEAIGTSPASSVGHQVRYPVRSNSTGLAMVEKQQYQKQLDDAIEQLAVNGPDAGREIQPPPCARVSPSHRKSQLTCSNTSKARFVTSA